MNECKHNDHGHFLLWLFVIGLCFNSSCLDCSGDHHRLQNRVFDLEYKVKQLEASHDSH